MINAAAAIEALRILNIKEEHIEKALKNAAVPARMEKLKGFLIDGAHNPSGAKAASELIGRQKGKKLLITGMLKSKDYEGTLSELIPKFDHVIAVDFFSFDAVKASVIADLAGKLGRSCETAVDARTAIEAARAREADLRVICGSLYLCGAVRGELLKEL